MNILRKISAHIFAFAMVSLLASCGNRSPHEVALAQTEDRPKAPEFPVGLDWLNTDHPVKLSDLRGKIVLLDFWTYGCINCMHVIPELKKLEQKYGNELVVIGVHSAKFATEKASDNIRQAVLRYELEHPVVNDKDFEVWNNYNIQAWPSFILIDPDGRIVGTLSGEGIYNVFDDAISKLITEYGAKGKLNRTPIHWALERDKTPKQLLSFPGKVAVDADGKNLYISDSDHNRIVVVSLADNTITATYGSGTAGLKDGAAAEAEFHRPQGITLDGDILYTTDTENHAIRKIDLRTHMVTTLAGTGQQSQKREETGAGTNVSLNSPWDLLVRDGKLYIAMAGPHQLWTLDLKTLEVKPFAGSGREDISDGALRSAALAQPSGITQDATKLYFVDSEASGVRSVDMKGNDGVQTIVGQGLFEFGDRDGMGPNVRLQHPLGVVFHDGLLYVADTYNNKIKVVNPANNSSQTFIGTGKEGLVDGDALNAQLNEPSGLAYAQGKLFIADDDNNAIRVYDFKTQQLSTLKIADAQREAVAQPAAPFRGKIIALPAQTVSASAKVVDINVTLPGGYKINTSAPFYVSVVSENSAVANVASSIREQNIDDPKFPLHIPVTLAPGQTTLTVDLVIYYCEAVKESLCKTKQLRVTLPLTVRNGNLAQNPLINVAVE